MRYNCYHKHTHVSNIFTPDTHIKTADYISRALELGHTTYFTTEHGTGGDIFEADTLCRKNGIHCKFGIEAYIVSGLQEKDGGNYHIVILPKTNAARKQLNIATSRANKAQFYRKPRLYTKDLLELDPNGYYITTACTSGLLSTDDAVQNILDPISEHFRENLMLEVQANWDFKQVEINEKAREYAKQHRLRMIAATDSHYIYPNQYTDRIDFLNGKNIHYPDEGNFTLDYPDGDTLFERFRKQGVLVDAEIQTAIESTLLLDACEDIALDTSIKMPNIYKDKTPEERYQMLDEEAHRKLEEICRNENVTGEEYEKRKAGTEDELKIIRDTIEINTQDYFLFNERMVDLAVNKYGGILTRTGRGSGGALYLNKLLGMTQIDRFEAKIPLYPERFISTARLLEARSLPDLDFNVVSQEPFVKATRELLGEKGCYPMVSYGTMQESEAFRNVCRAKQIDFDEFNEAAKKAGNKTMEKRWEDIRRESQKYVDTIVSASIHPCSYLLMDSDIEEEVGVVRIGDNICAMITSSEADAYKYLKNDYLVVTVWAIISETFKMIHQPIMTVRALLETTKDDPLTWEMYARGLTCTLNQIDTEYATSLMLRYKARSVEEVEMFVAALRPSFNAWRESFITREDYTTKVPELDRLLAPTKGYILFQENVMQFFGWLGIDAATSIGLIKKISKKTIKEEDFAKLESQLREAWIRNTGSIAMFHETWSDVMGVMAYGFNAPHAYATAIDSLYGAYLKSHYPLEYFTVVLNTYADETDKTSRLTDELKTFKIRQQPPKFGYSSDVYMPDAEKRVITKGISSIKYMNAACGVSLYNLANGTEFHDFLSFLIQNKADKILNERQLDILIRIGFFSEFGNIPTLLAINRMFAEMKGGSALEFSLSAVQTSLYGEIIKKHSNNLLKDGKPGKKWKVTDMEGLLREAQDAIVAQKLPERDIKLQIKDQEEFIGHISLATNKQEDRRKLFVSSVNPMYGKQDGQVWGYAVFAQSIGSGKASRWTITSRKYKENPVEPGDVIYVHNYTMKTRPSGTFYYLEEYWKVA